MTTADLTFGVEIECSLPAGIVEIGGYHAGTQVAWLPAGWNAQRDGSLGSLYRNGRVGVEIVSPILKGAEGLAQLIAAVKAIRQRGGKVTTACGLHIHVGYPTGDGKLMDRLVHVHASSEKALFAVTGTRRREYGHYCRPVAGQWARANHADRASMANVCSKYQALNLSYLLAGHPHVEFRAFAGTLDVVKIVSYLRFVLGIVERAIDGGAFPYTVAPAAGTKKFGGVNATAGVAEFKRWAHYFGWTGKYATKKFGARVWGGLDCEGAPTMARCVAELNRLAAKYDGAAA